MKILVLWHVFCISVWSCPAPSKEMLDGKVHPAPLALGDWIRLGDHLYLKQLQAVKAYLFVGGSWQYWDMFAPDPANSDWYGDSLITFKDGTTKVFDYPRMYTLSIPKKYLEERYRKFFERAHSEERSYFYTPFMYREALESYTDPKNPPVKISLRWHSRTIADPGQVQKQDYFNNTYYIGEIDQKVLDQMKAADK